ncbi:MAG TPA: Gfo/Idh/MocA family oxidoreductase, partial [Candidatus Methylomirabilis sp.]|nr:Gfo/Idh/MocA family oxidoreductase [Candidatus Methylomirabilis sp.]
VRFRFVLLGTGFYARKWLEAVTAREDCEVVALASRSPARAEELQRDFDLAGAAVYPGWEMAAAKGAADGVLITLPQMLHPQATVSALRTGLHVLVEKPLSVDIADARTVLEEARRHPTLAVMVNQNYRWRPHIQALRRSIQEGLVGRVGHILVEVRQQIRRKTVDGWREKMPEPFLLDFAIHHFDLIRYLTGDEATRVMGHSFRPSWSWFEGNAAAAAILTLQGGAVVDFGGTMVSLGVETPQEGLITVIGEKGALHLDEDSQVTLHGQGEVRTLPQEPVPGGELGYALTEFLGAVRERRQPETYVAEHVRSLALSLAVVESSRRGAPVEMAELLGFLDS